MERKATSRDNPWIQTVWLYSLLGIVISAVALWIGHQALIGAAETFPTLSLLLFIAGSALLTASLVTLGLGFTVSAYLWERKNP